MTIRPPPSPWPSPPGEGTRPGPRDFSTPHRAHYGSLDPHARTRRKSCNSPDCSPRSLSPGERAGVRASFAEDLFHRRSPIHGDKTRHHHFSSGNSHRSGTKEPLTDPSTDHEVGALDRRGESPGVAAPRQGYLFAHSRDSIKRPDTKHGITDLPSRRDAGRWRRIHRPPEDNQVVDLRGDVWDRCGSCTGHGGAFPIRKTSGEEGHTVLGPV